MLRRWVYLSGVLCMLALAGCANNDSQNCLQLSKQQSATIQSLQAEVSRLNQELEDTIVSRQDLEAEESRLRKILGQEILQGDIRLTLEKRGLVIAALDRVLFVPEESRLKPSAEELLDKIAVVIGRDFPENYIGVEGYTDAQPVEGGTGITNWEYSIDRAAVVLHYFLDVKGLPAEQFKVTGYGEYRPVDSNKTPEGREHNRRIEIVISPEKAVGAK